MPSASAINTAWYWHIFVVFTSIIGYCDTDHTSLFAIVTITTLVESCFFNFVINSPNSLVSKAADRAQWIDSIRRYHHAYLILRRRSALQLTLPHYAYKLLFNAVYQHVQFIQSVVLVIQRSNDICRYSFIHSSNVSCKALIYALRNFTSWLSKRCGTSTACSSSIVTAISLPNSWTTIKIKIAWTFIAPFCYQWQKI